MAHISDQEKFAAVCTMNRLDPRH